MTRVALLHPVFWPQVTRGSERYIADLATHLIRRGHEVEIICSHEGPPCRADVAGVPVRFSSRHGRRDHFLQRHGFDDFWNHLPGSARRLFDGDYDLAHAFYPTDGLLAAAWGRLRRKPSIFSSMGLPNPNLSIRLDAEPKASRWCDRVSVDSVAVARVFRHRWAIDPQVIYPGVDLERFAPAGTRDPDPLVLCPASADVARKRVEWVARAVVSARASVPAIRLLALRPRDPAKRAALLAIDPSVEFFDSVSDQDLLSRVYSRAWVTVLASKGEAFGMVLTESLACGTPIVASDVDAAPEIIGDSSCGECFPEDLGEHGLTAALIRVLEQSPTPALVRSRAERFSIEATTSAFERIYAELLSA